MRIALYHSNRDNAPKSADVTWGQLIEILTRHQFTDCAPCAGHDCVKKFGRAWSPVDIGGRRLNEQVRAVSALVLDFDGLTQEQAVDVARRLQAFTHIGYSTHSHAPARGFFAFRAVIQLTRAVEAPRWRDFLWRAVSYLGVPADPTCKDLSRLYFLPTAPKGAATFAAAHEAVPMNVDAVLELPGPSIPAATSLSTRASVAFNDPSTVDLDELRKKLKTVSNEQSKALAQAILKGEPVGFSETQRRSGSPNLARDDGLQRAASLVAWACPIGTPIPALFELLRPSLSAMDLAPEGFDYWFDELMNERDGMLKRAVERKAATLEREEHAHKAMLQEVFDFAAPAAQPFQQGSNPAPQTVAPAPGQSAPSVQPPSGGPAFSAAQSGAPVAPVGGGDVLDELEAMDHAPPPFAGAGEGPAKESSSWSTELIYKYDKEGNAAGLKNCLANARVVLLHDKLWKGMVRRNAFTGGTELWGGPIFDAPLEEPLALADEHVTKIASWMQQRSEVTLRLELSTVQLYEVIQSVAVENEYNPLRDYVDSVEWDGTARLDTWLETYLGVKTTDASGEDITAYVRAVASKWLIAAVARVYEPGCQVQNVLLLEGEQGLRKSTALRVLASRAFFTDAAMDIGAKDTSMMTTRTWIIELAELDAFRKSENTQAKAFFTRDWEEFRPPYGRTLVKRPRLCIFAGTSNRDDYLTDPTGNRRYWPVFCTKVDLAGLARDRDQIWAEARERYEAGRGSDHLWWLTKAEEALAFRVAEERLAADEWDEAVIRWWANVAGKPSDVRMFQVLEVALGIPKERLNNAAQQRAGAALRRLGFVKRRKREAGRLVWFYEPGPSLAVIDAPKVVGATDHLTMLQGGA